MIEKTISDKFFGGGLIISPSNSENVRKLDYGTIVKLFEKNGLILFRDFNFFRLKNHHPQIIPSIGKTTQEIPNVFLMKKSAIKTPTIPMGFSVGKLGGIPLTSSLGLNPIKLAKTSREMIMIKIPIISNLRSFILTYFLESENIKK